MQRQQRLLAVALTYTFGWSGHLNRRIVAVWSLSSAHAGQQTICELQPAEGGGAQVAFPNIDLKRGDISTLPRLRKEIEIYISSAEFQETWEFVVFLTKRVSLVSCGMRMAGVIASGYRSS